MAYHNDSIRSPSKYRVSRDRRCTWLRRIYISVAYLILHHVPATTELIINFTVNSVNLRYYPYFMIIRTISIGQQ